MGSGRSRQSNIVMHGATSSALCIPPDCRTVFHLATSVGIPLFEAELAAFARQVEAGPHKQIVLVRGLRGLA